MYPYNKTELKLFVHTRHFFIQTMPPPPPSPQFSPHPSLSLPFPAFAANTTLIDHAAICYLLFAPTTYYASSSPFLARPAPTKLPFPFKPIQAHSNPAPPSTCPVYMPKEPKIIAYPSSNSSCLTTQLQMAFTLCGSNTLADNNSTLKSLIRFNMGKCLLFFM